MKHTLTTTILFAAVLASACSEQNSTPTKEGVAPAPAKTVLTQDIPNDLKGFPFEAGGKCAVDAVNTPEKGQTSTINKADGMNVDGWAFDDKKTNVPAALALQLVNANGQYFYSMLNRHAGREDLVKAFGKADYAAAGYSASVDITALPAGSYDMLVIQKTENKNLVCPTYRKLVVKG